MSELKARHRPPAPFNNLSPQQGSFVTKGKVRVPLETLAAVTLTEVAHGQLDSGVPVPAEGWQAGPGVAPVISQPQRHSLPTRGTPAEGPALHERTLNRLRKAELLSKHFIRHRTERLGPTAGTYS